MLSLLGDQYYFEEKSEVEINVVKRNNISWSVQVLTPKIIFNRKDLRFAQLITNLYKYHFIEGDLQRKKFKSKETFLGRRSWSSG